MTRRQFGLSAAGAIAVAAPVPRLAPNHVFTLPDGGKVPLSSFKGKVVALSFILTTCSHCQHTCEMLQSLQVEWKAKGFQPLAMAFNPMAHLLIGDFRQEHKVEFPVFYGERSDVDAIMGFNPDHRILVPQMALIDRRGNIRFQTPEDSDARLSNEVDLRKLIEPILK